jgi:hypothetical protein
MTKATKKEVVSWVLTFVSVFFGALVLELDNLGTETFTLASLGALGVAAVRAALKQMWLMYINKTK